MHSFAILPAVDVEEAARAASSPDVLLLDVREYHEWMAGHAPAATHVPMSELPRRVADLPTTGRIVCVCRSGNRSAQVTAWLQRQGYDAVNMTGGMQQWALRGHQVVNHAGNLGSVV